MFVAGFTAIAVGPIALESVTVETLLLLAGLITVMVSLPELPLLATYTSFVTGFTAIAFGSENDESEIEVTA